MTVVKNESARRPRGRPRAFDRAAALVRAAETFWELGYEGASIADLTRAMGITAQSLYAAFGSKEALYREALDWYRGTFGGPLVQMLQEESDVVTALARLLAAQARAFAGADRPHGCMVSTAVLTCAEENLPIARHLAGLRSRTMALLRARIERGIAEGQLRPDTDAEALARFVAVIVQGMSVQALDGATVQALLAVAALGADEIARHRA